MSLRQQQGLALELGGPACLMAAKAEMWSGAEEMSWYRCFVKGNAGCLMAEGAVAVKVYGHVAH